MNGPSPSSVRHDARRLRTRIRRVPWLGSLGVSADAVRGAVPADVMAMVRAIDAERWDVLPASPELLVCDIKCPVSG